MAEALQTPVAERTEEQVDSLLNECKQRVFFQQFPLSIVRGVCEVLTAAPGNADDRLWEEGDDMDKFYFILSGSVHMMKTIDEEDEPAGDELDDYEQDVCTFYAGDCVGVDDFFLAVNMHSRKCAAKVTEPSIIGMCSKQDFVATFASFTSTPVWAPHACRAILQKEPGTRTSYELTCLVQFLEDLRFLRQFDTETLAVCAARLKYATREAGELVFEQGQDGKDIFILLKGEVDVHMKGEQPNAIDSIRYDAEWLEKHGGSVSKLSVGDAIGETGIRLDKPRNATIAVPPVVPIASVAKANDITTGDKEDTATGTDVAGDDANKTKEGGEDGADKDAAEDEDAEEEQVPVVDSITSPVELLIIDKELYNDCFRDQTDVLWSMESCRRVLNKAPADRTENDVKFLVEFVGPISFFQQISIGDRAHLCRFMTLETIEEGATVLQQGSIAEAFYVILGGNASVHMAAHTTLPSSSTDASSSGTPPVAPQVALQIIEEDSDLDRTSSDEDAAGGAGGSSLSELAGSKAADAQQAGVSAEKPLSVVDCVVARLGPGDSFGEMSIMTGRAVSATVKAISHDDDGESMLQDTSKVGQTGEGTLLRMHRVPLEVVRLQASACRDRLKKYKSKIAFRPKNCIKIMRMDRLERSEHDLTELVAYFSRMHIFRFVPPSLLRRMCAAMRYEELTAHETVCGGGGAGPGKGYGRSFGGIGIRKDSATSDKSNSHHRHNHDTDGANNNNCYIILSGSVSVHEPLGAPASDQLAEGDSASKPMMISAAKSKWGCSLKRVVGNIKRGKQGRRATAMGARKLGRDASEVWKQAIKQLKLSAHHTSESSADSSMFGSTSRVLTAGDSFGAIAALAGDGGPTGSARPVSQTVVTREASELCVIDHDLFRTVTSEVEGFLTEPEECIRALKLAPDKRQQSELSHLMQLTRTNSFLRQLSKDARRYLCRHMEYHRVEPGAAVCQQGEVGTDFYIVLYGSAGVYRNNDPAAVQKLLENKKTIVQAIVKDAADEEAADNGDEIQGDHLTMTSAEGKGEQGKWGIFLGYLRQGDSFGEQSMHDKSDGLRNASVVAAPDGSGTLELVRIHKQHFLHMVEVMGQSVRFHPTLHKAHLQRGVQGKRGFELDHAYDQYEEDDDDKNGKRVYKEPEELEAITESLFESISAYRGLPRSAVLKVAKGLEYREYKDGQFLFSQGDPVHETDARMHFVVEGAVSLVDVGPAKSSAQRKEAHGHKKERKPVEIEVGRCGIGARVGEFEMIPYLTTEAKPASRAELVAHSQQRVLGAKAVGESTRTVSLSRADYLAFHKELAHWGNASAFGLTSIVNQLRRSFQNGLSKAEEAATEDNSSNSGGVSHRKGSGLNNRKGSGVSSTSVSASAASVLNETASVRRMKADKSICILAMRCCLEECSKGESIMLPIDMSTFILRGECHLVRRSGGAMSLLGSGNNSGSMSTQQLQERREYEGPAKRRNFRSAREHGLVSASQRLRSAAPLTVMGVGEMLVTETPKSVRSQGGGDGSDGSDGRDGSPPEGSCAGQSASAVPEVGKVTLINKSTRPRSMDSGVEKWLQCAAAGTVLLHVPKSALEASNLDKALQETTGQVQQLRRGLHEGLAEEQEEREAILSLPVPALESLAKEAQKAGFVPEVADTPQAAIQAAIQAAPTPIEALATPLTYGGAAATTDAAASPMRVPERPSEAHASKRRQGSGSRRLRRRASSGIASIGNQAEDQDCSIGGSTSSRLPPPLARPIAHTPASERQEALIKRRVNEQARRERRRKRAAREAQLAKRRARDHQQQLQLERQQAKTRAQTAQAVHSVGAVDAAAIDGAEEGWGANARSKALLDNALTDLHEREQLIRAIAADDFEQEREFRKPIAAGFSAGPASVPPPPGDLFSLTSIGVDGSAAAAEQYLAAEAMVNDEVGLAITTVGMDEEQGGNNDDNDEAEEEEDVDEEEMPSLAVRAPAGHNGGQVHSLSHELEMGLYFDFGSGGKYNWTLRPHDLAPNPQANSPLAPLNFTISQPHAMLQPLGPVRQLSNRHQHLLPEAGGLAGKPAAPGPLAHLLHARMRPVIKTGRGFRDMMSSPRSGKGVGSYSARPRFRPSSRASNSSSNGRPDSRMSDWQISGSRVNPAFRYI